MDGDPLLTALRTKVAGLFSSKQAFDVPCPMYNPQQLDPACYRAIEDQVTFKALDRPHSDRRISRIPVVSDGSDLGHFCKLSDTGLCRCQEASRHVETGILTKKDEVVRQISFGGNSSEYASHMPLSRLSYVESSQALPLDLGPIFGGQLRSRTTLLRFFQQPL
jgi:hypothetical protein